MMRIPNLGFLFGLLALAASGGLLTAGCGKTDSPVGAVHPVTGAACESPGARAPASDGCNECTCESGTWACTELDCTAACTPGAMKPADDGCNTCTCQDDGGWACTEEGCTIGCAEGDTRWSGCNNCWCSNGAWICTMMFCGAECRPGETRLGELRTDGQCRICTCTSDGGWDCAFSACECSAGDVITAADGCNGCTCGADSQWGACGEVDCVGRCPLPRHEVDCDANPVYAKTTNGSCCRYECPSDAPPGWPQYASLEACEGSCPNGSVLCGAECVDPLTSLQHCGACANTCATANATPICVAGACAIDECLPGFADCNGDSADGCEVDAASDLNNCGACGVVCALANASSACTNGVCVLQSCDVGFADCDGLVGDGCEVNTESDPSNCGLCGNVCSGSSPACINGTCPIE